jgi:outer membrane immunogenic protein
MHTFGNNRSTTVKSLAVSVAVAALLCGSAFAADLPTRKAPMAPAFVPPPSFTWTGFYVGVNGGYSFSDNGHTNTTGSPAFGALGPAFVPGSLGSNSGGFIGGGQLGYNYQSGMFVGGIETDIDYVDQRKTASFTGAVIAPLGTSLTTTATRKLDYLGTLRGRIGITPFDRSLLYVTGGLAYGGVSNSGSVVANAAPALNWNGGTSSTRVGFAVGGGGEYAFTNNITFKIEYLYYDLGATSFATTGSPAVQATPALAGVYYTGQSRTEGSILRGGLNYKF